MSIRPFWFQQNAIDALYQFFYSGKQGNPLIALPTGTGKSVVNALFIESLFARWPRIRVMMLTHVKELIEQNQARMLQAWPLAPVGIHSAGLKQRDVAQPIIFGGIQSVYKKIAAFGHIDILIIDEAHLLGQESTSMYQLAIAALREVNPRLVVIGLTATAFRLKQGDLTNAGIFTDTVFDMCSVEGFNRLVSEGFLAPLYPRRTKTEFDVSNVGMVKGEFNKSDLEKAVDKPDITRRILAEMCHEGDTREHWLIFASGVKHAEHINSLLNDEFGVSSVVVHSKISSGERTERLNAFTGGRVRCAVNNNVLTTGFDFPAIDLIGMLRPTLSPGLWVQMCGRGTRPSLATGKQDCIVLDFAGNTRRLGPINDPVKPQAKMKGKPGDAPVRICDQCGTYCHASARECYCCGNIFVFSFDAKLQRTASTDELIRSDAPDVQTLKVNRVWYRRHVSTKRPDAKPCIKVTYLCGLRAFDEWWHLDAPGRAGKEARDKWRLRAAFEPPRPETCAPFEFATDAALKVIEQLREPKAIRVWINRPNPEIQSVEF